MSRVVTVRLSDEEYRRILEASKSDHRPISNFMTLMTLKRMEESNYADAIEMAQIRSDKSLLRRLKAGHRDAKAMKGRFVE